MGLLRHGNPLPLLSMLHMGYWPSMIRPDPPASHFLRLWASATLIAGTADILSAFFFAGLAGVAPIPLLNYVASGPFGDGVSGAGWAVIGLLAHYVIMGCMAGTYLLAAQRIPLLVRHPIAAGLVYGLLLWILMYWIVKPLRWPDAPLPHTAYGIANALFSHCILVGLPIAMIAARGMRTSRL